MWVRVVSLILFLVSLWGCDLSSRDYRSCEELVHVAKSEVFRSLAMEFIDENIINKKINDDEALLGGGMIPGSYWLVKEFNWAKIGFPDSSQLRIVGDLDHVEAISFQEQTRLAILVKVNDSFGIDGIGIREGDLAIVNERIAVYCRVND